MKNKTTQFNRKLKSILDLDKRTSKLPALPAVEKKLLETEQFFQANYYSNKLEGNKLSEAEARKAVLTID